MFTNDRTYGPDFVLRTIRFRAKTGPMLTQDGTLFGIKIMTMSNSTDSRG